MSLEFKKPPARKPKEPAWWLQVGGEPQGPFCTADLRQRLELDEITEFTPARPDGELEWKPLWNWPQLAAVVQTAETEALPIDEEQAGVRAVDTMWEKAHPYAARGVTPMAMLIALFGIYVEPIRAVLMLIAWGLPLWVFLREGAIITRMADLYDHGTLVVIPITLAVILIQVLVAGGMLLGGMRLLQMRESCLRLLKFAIWSDLACRFVAGVARLVYFPREGGSVDIGWLLGIEIMFGLLTWVFEIVAIVWLHVCGGRWPLVPDAEYLCSRGGGRRC